MLILKKNVVVHDRMALPDAGLRTILGGRALQELPDHVLGQLHIDHFVDRDEGPAGVEFDSALQDAKRSKLNG